VTKTEALIKGLVLNGWTLTDCPSGRHCYTKPVKIKGSELTQPYYMFVLSGTLRGGVSKAIGKSARCHSHTIGLYEECGRKGMTLQQVAESRQAIKTAAAGLAALRAKVQS